MPTVVQDLIRDFSCVCSDRAGKNCNLNVLPSCKLDRFLTLIRRITSCLFLSSAGRCGRRCSDCCAGGCNSRTGCSSTEKALAQEKGH